MPSHDSGAAYQCLVSSAGAASGRTSSNIMMPPGSLTVWGLGAVPRTRVAAVVSLVGATRASPRSCMARCEARDSSVVPARTAVARLAAVTAGNVVSIHSHSIVLFSRWPILARTVQLPAAPIKTRWVSPGADKVRRPSGSTASQR
jgi:hypothetical protein